MSKEKILVICAHPDDEIIGAGGTIAKYSQEGRNVTVIIFSYGELSHPWIKKKVTIGTRVNESRTAGEIVGCKDTIFLGAKEGHFIDKRKTITKTIEKVINDLKPSKIFVHSFDDRLYADHKAVHEIVMSTIDRMDYKGNIYTFNIWNMVNSQERYCPKLMVDVSKTFKLKTKALGCFKSQKLAMLQLLPVVYLRAIRNGLYMGVKFAERFSKIR